MTKQKTVELLQYLRVADGRQMKAHPLKISGSWKIEFQKFEDNRGFFYESFKAEAYRYKNKMYISGVDF